MIEEINWLDKINETADYIKSKVNHLPKTAIILGTGLGELVDHIKIETAISYTDIPNFPVSTVEGHRADSSLAILATNTSWPCRAVSTSMRATP